MQALGHRAMSATGRLRSAGFTLIELLVVLAVAGLLVAIVPMAFNKLQEGSQYRSTLRTLIAAMRQAHRQAMVAQQPVVFQVDVVSRHFGIRGQPTSPIPESLEVKTITGTGAGEPVGDKAEIIFLPQGGSTGGTIELARPSGGGVRIRVDWLSGEITQHPRLP